MLLLASDEQSFLFLGVDEVPRINKLFVVSVNDSMDLAFEAIASCTMIAAEDACKFALRANSFIAGVNHDNKDG